MLTGGHIAVGPPVLGAIEGVSVDVDESEVLVVVAGVAGDIPGQGAGVQHVKRDGLVRPLVRGGRAGLGHGLVADVWDNDGERSVQFLLAFI